MSKLRLRTKLTAVTERKHLLFEYSFRFLKEGSPERKAALLLLPDFLLPTDKKLLSYQCHLQS